MISYRIDCGIGSAGCIQSTNKDGALYGNFGPAVRQSTSTAESPWNHICIAFGDVTSARRISVSHEAQNILQPSYAKTTLGVERNNTSTGGSAI